MVHVFKIKLHSNEKEWVHFPFTQYLSRVPMFFCDQVPPWAKDGQEVLQEL